MCGKAISSSSSPFGPNSLKPRPESNPGTYRSTAKFCGSISCTPQLESHIQSASQTGSRDLRKALIGKTPPITPALPKYVAGSSSFSTYYYDLAERERAIRRIEITNAKPY